MKITTWRPDTCDCELNYEWDETVAQDKRVHTINSISVCIAHKNIATKEQIWDKVREENTTKNIVLGLILDNFPNLVSESQNENGDTVKRLKQGIEYKWEFDENRNLIIDLQSASGVEKSVLLTFLKDKFGLNKIRIV